MYEGGNENWWKSLRLQADQLGTTKIDEDGLLELVRTKPGKKSVHEVKSEKAATPRKATPSKATPKKTTPKEVATAKGGCQPSGASQSSQDSAASTSSTPAQVKGSSPAIAHGRAWAREERRVEPGAGRWGGGRNIKHYKITAMKRAF